MCVNFYQERTGIVYFQISNQDHELTHSNRVCNRVIFNVSDTQINKTERRKSEG